MVDRVERVVETTDRPVETVPVDDARVGGAVLLARIITYITSVILAILAIRFVLVLLGANKGSGFVDFIYSISHPFVAPFFGIFSYNPSYGVSRVEMYTIVAMIVYALIGYGLARLVTIGRPARTADV